MTNTAGLDPNSRRALSALSSANDGAIVNLWADPTTHRLLVDNAGAMGTVTSVSVVSANGFAGTVATATTTPAITLSTTVTGLLKGNGTAISAATSGTDYAPATSGSSILYGNGLGGFSNVTVSTGLSFVGGTLTATASGLTVGTTTITSGTNTRILYDNSGVLGEYTITGTGTVVAMATSPSFTTPILGTPQSGNLSNCTAYPIASVANLGTGVATFLTTPSSANLASAVTDETGSGSLVFATTPTLVTPILGVATATSINKVAVTAPASSATLTIADGKTLTYNNSITIAGTDSTTMTMPSTSATIARTDAAQTFTGTQTFSQVITTANAITASGNAATVPVTSRHNIVTNNSAATLTVTLTTTSAVNMQLVIVQILDFSAVAQTITWVNTENSTITAPTTSNGSTSLPLTVGFIYNSATSKWRCIASA